MVLQVSPYNYNNRVSHMVDFCKIEILLRLALNLKASYCDVRKTRKDIVSLTKASNKRKDRSSLDEKKSALEECCRKTKLLLRLPAIITKKAL